MPTPFPFNFGDTQALSMANYVFMAIMGMLAIVHVSVVILFYYADEYKGLTLIASIMTGALTLGYFYLWSWGHQTVLTIMLILHVAASACMLNINRMLLKHNSPFYISETNIAIVVFAFANIFRTLFVHKVKSNFASDGRLEWHKDVIHLEKLLTKCNTGHERVSDREVVECIRKSNRKLDPKAYFCRLCDDPAMNELADDFELLDILRNGYKISGSKLDHMDKELPEIEYENYISQCLSLDETEYSDTERDEIARTVDLSRTKSSENFVELLNVSQNDLLWLKSREMLATPPKYKNSSKLWIRLSTYNKLVMLNRVKMRGVVSKDSIERVLTVSEASKLFSFISRSFEEQLTFLRFKENMRQTNIDRSNLVSTLRNNQRTLRVISNSLSALEMFILVIFFVCIFSTNGLFFKIISPIFILTFPIVWNIMNSFIFIISTHPYDIGDRVHIAGDNLIVRDIGLTSTVFERWNNEFVVITNQYIREHPIKNIRRSKSQQWKIEFYISSHTRPELLKEFISNLKNFVENNPAFEHITIGIDEIKDCNFYKAVFIIRHAINHQNGFFMWQVQNKFMRKLVDECNRHKILYIKPEWRLS